MRHLNASVLVRLGIWSALGLVHCVPANAGDGSLRNQLRDLALAHGFRLTGVEKLGEEPQGTFIATDPLAQQLKALLQHFNFYTIAGSGDQLRELVITSRLHPRVPQPPSNYVATRRVGAHHEVNATLFGPNNVALPSTLIVDTGASAIVLPLSLAAELGFEHSTLQDGTARTAGGAVAVKVGMLTLVKLGNVSATNVLVNFIPDDTIEETRLLGMSFLQRFKMTIDDARQELILLSR